MTFTEPIDPATVTPASMRVTINGSPVAGHLNLLDGNATARFAPDAALPFDAIVVLELTSAITDLFENPLVDGAGAPLTNALTFTFLTGTFGITNPINGSDVLENSALTLTAQASSSLNLASVTFAVNDQALPPDAAAPFSIVYNVGASGHDTDADNRRHWS